MQKITIDSYAPEFSGFYNTIYEWDDDFLYQYLSEDYEDIDNCSKDYWEFMDNRMYMSEVSKEYVYQLNWELKRYKILKEIHFEYECVVSPREYNFTTDSINCQLTFKKGRRTQKKILSYLRSHWSEFDDWCHEKYSSYDGFISFLPNNAKDFMKKLKSGERHDQLWTEIVTFLIHSIDSGIYEEVEDETYDHTEEIMLNCFDYEGFEKCLPTKIKQQLQELEEND